MKEELPLGAYEFSFPKLKILVVDIWKLLTLKISVEPLMGQQWECVMSQEL